MNAKQNANTQSYFQTIFNDISLGKEVSKGTRKAFSAWYYSQDHAGWVVMCDHLWADEVEDFINTLKEAGVTEFIHRNTSTSVMYNLVSFLKLGCQITGTERNGLIIKL